jgi:lipid-binding SYLF domain-containing protein
LSADLISYSISKGLYGGFSVDGSVVGSRTSWNQAFYGTPVSPADVLIKGSVKSPDAAALLQAVSKLASN